MIKMTDEMRDLIDNAIANGTPCILATASKAGEPHMSFRGSVMVFDDTSLALWDRVKRQSLQHITENPQVCVLFRHPQKRIIWQFVGEATVHHSGPVRDQVMARVVQPELDRDPERQESVRLTHAEAGDEWERRQREAVDPPVPHPDDSQREQAST